jgi:hypothetical protein
MPKRGTTVQPFGEALAWAHLYKISMPPTPRFDLIAFRKHFKRKRAGFE